MYLVCLITASTPDEASRIARALVEERLAACVNVVPGIRSVYRWREAIEEADELLLVAKTTAASFERLRERVLALHSYEVPEIVALPIESGHPDYLMWMAESVGGSAAGR
ncbi:MAG: divalent-cation tolerance protein CutA [Armatimonadota bacterium]|nr:divalent-cation tolerance protein CutA [Armatimonadota bacterium]MDR5696815.1 divalent-cation tolerance protein CutA [Armatimonadota bacterium]